MILTQQADMFGDPGAALEASLAMSRGERRDQRQAAEHQERHLDAGQSGQDHPGRPVHPAAGAVLECQQLKFKSTPHCHCRLNLGRRYWIFKCGESGLSIKLGNCCVVLHTPAWTVASLNFCKYQDLAGAVGGGGC